MVRRITLIRRRADLTPEEFHRYWLEQHASIGLALPGLRGYRINSIVDGSPEVDWDGLGELWFDSIDAARAALSVSPAAELIRQDIPNFIADMRPFFVEEHVIKAPPSVATPAPAEADESSPQEQT